MEGAKDPDEFIIKYGNNRFKMLVDKALSVIEFKVKLLRKDLNLENVKDKIKFLNEIAKLIAKIDNTMEREIYIENIAKEHAISKEAIYGEVNKITYSQAKSEKVLNTAKPVIHRKEETEKVSKDIKKRENTVISILLSDNIGIFQIIKQNINVEDFKDEINKKIIQKLYEEFEKGNSNINSIIDNLEEEEQNHITEIMAEDYGMDNLEKAVDDVVQAYEKEKLNNRKFEILNLLESNLEANKKKELEKELNNIVIRLAKIK